jgi:hypothetical protein
MLWQIQSMMTICFNKMKTSDLAFFAFYGAKTVDGILGDLGFIASFDVPEEGFRLGLMQD